MGVNCLLYPSKAMYTHFIFSLNTVKMQLYFDGLITYLENNLMTTSPHNTHKKK